MVDFVAETHAMSSNYVVEVVSAQRSGNNYATEWLMGGTHDGPLQLLGLPATGKQWRVRGASVGQLNDDGRIKLHRDYWNLAAFLTQVGVLPPPPSATEAAGGSGGPVVARSFACCCEARGARASADGAGAHERIGNEGITRLGGFGRSLRH